MNAAAVIPFVCDFSHMFEFLTVARSNMTIYKCDKCSRKYSKVPASDKIIFIFKILTKIPTFFVVKKSYYKVLHLNYSFCKNPYKLLFKVTDQKLNNMQNIKRFCTLSCNTIL